MKRFWWIALLLTAAPWAPAQQQTTPHIGYIYPAGGGAGSTFQVTVGGQYLSSINAAFISGSGLQTTVLEVHKPLTMKQVNDLRERLKLLRRKETKDSETMKEILDIAKKLVTFNRNANPSIAETVTLQVTITPNAEPTERELRLASSSTISNPRIFCISQLPEFVRKPATDAKEIKSFQDIQKIRNREPQASEPLPDMNITLPAVINGQIMPGRVDRYRFDVKQGQRLVIACSARALIPYLSDAVPGWFQSAVGLYDSKHTELVYNDEFRFHPDPVLYYDIQHDDGETLDVNDSLYRGREGFNYCITIGELPFITSI